MVTYKKLLEMLDSVEKTEDGKKFKSKIKKLKKQTTELIEDQDTEGKGPAGKRVKEIKAKTTGRSIGPAGASIVSDDGKRIKLAKGGSVKKKNKMITTKGFGASRAT
jgi:hypothetical protein